MRYEEIKQAFEEARATIDAADLLAKRSVPFMVGRLRRLHLSPDDLRALKRELQGFDSHTGRWKP